MLGKNSIKVFDHIFPQKLTLTFLADHSLTPCIILLKVSGLQTLSTRKLSTVNRF
jgi:hypothetical protein